MRTRRVAVIYDDLHRPETTGGYCLRALQELVEAAHVRPADAGQLSPGDFDLFVRVDDGLDYTLPQKLHPLAWWAIDTHLDLDRCLAQARSADLTFAAQRPGADALRRAGIASAEWLPLACNPITHRRHDVPKRYDVCFIGNLLPGPRTETLDALRREFPCHFVGRAYFDDMARTYSASRAVFNRSVRDDLNMRVFEALACGSLLVTNDLPESGQSELFQDGTHLATYRSVDELLDKLRFYLIRPEERARVERAGWQAAIERHTYRHRMEHIITSAGRLVQRVVAPVAAPAGSPPAAPAAYDPTYFEFDRPELLALIPADARDVVDVGCGAGRLGRSLKARQPARVVGVERDPGAAAAARSHLDLVLEGDIESLEWPFPPASFDAVVCGDVLEHLRDPLAVVRRIRAWLRPSGTLVVSLPNVRHHSVVRGLLTGDWTYEPAGLLDHTHLRFFTRREIEKLLYRAGFAVPKLASVPGPGYRDWEAAGRPGAVQVGALRIGPLAPEEAEEFYTYQWLAAARACERSDHGLTSIVVVTHNQVQYTRQCVESIRLLTDEPFELIFVDNGSTDGTPDYLRRLATDPDVRVVLNPDNRGFPVGANQGMRIASGRQVLLLNNDTVVTTGWLERLLQALHSNAQLGLVGPCSNHVSGEQQVAVTYTDLAGLDGFAWEWAKARAGRVEGTDRLVGFCLLIRREVVDRIGFLDEGFGIGNFEDDDYCVRALRAGFQLAIARAAFVHHIGGVSFGGAGVDYIGLLRANRWRFAQKWESADAGSEPLPKAGSGESIGGLRVLLLAHVGLFRDRMDKSHYRRYEALAQHPGVTLFGPGVPGYRPGMSAQEAVVAACGGKWPDAIVHGCDPKASGVPLVTGLAEAPVLTALELLDSWTFEDRQVEFIRRNRFTLGLIQEVGHHIQFYRSRCPGVEFVWTPNAVDTRQFRDHGLEKEYDIVLYGALEQSVYPLRARLARLLAAQNEFRVRHLPHPGYYPDRDVPVIAGEELSRAINRAWIGIATRSIYHCFLMKYLEIAASGALVAGDIPDSARSVFADNCLELSMGEGDEEILDRFRAVLSDKGRLRSMAMTAHRNVVTQFSTTAFAERVLTTLATAVARRRGANDGLTSIVPVHSPRGESVAGRPTPSFAAVAGVNGGLLLRPKAPVLSGCLIVRNNAGTIRQCLTSLRPWVDELVVVDTGSTDETPQIARELGARVFHFPWCDDFSAARNESVRHARGEWVFWMDSDDTIDEANGRGLRGRAAGSHREEVLGYVVQVHCPGPGESGRNDVTAVDHVKLFRNRPDLRFEGRIHEQILPAIRRASGEVEWTDLFVVHSGYDHSPAGQKRKVERDLRLLHLELAERPAHPFTLFNLGMTYTDIGRHAEAVDCLERSLRNSEPGESHRRKAYALLASSRSRLGQTAAALAVCGRGLTEFPGDVELAFRQGILLHEAGRLPEAARAYERLLATGHNGRYFSSMDRGLCGYKARQNLAAVYADLGEWDRVESEWRAVVADAPDYRTGWRGLGEVLLRRKVAEAQELADRLTGRPGLRAEGLLLAGRVAIAQGRLDEARRCWEAAAAEDPGDAEPLRQLGRLHFEAGEDEAAERALRELVRRDPDDAAGYHNLGSILLRQNQGRDATEAFRRSIELRPGSAETHICLGHALHQCKDRDGAAAAWRAALAVDPGNAEAAQALHRSAAAASAGS